MSGLRDRIFLAASTSLSFLLLVVGTWEWAIAGAVHQLLLGAVTLALTSLAWFFRRRHLRR